MKTEKEIIERMIKIGEDKEKNFPHTDDYIFRLRLKELSWVLGEEKKKIETTVCPKCGCPDYREEHLLDSCATNQKKCMKCYHVWDIHYGYVSVYKK